MVINPFSRHRLSLLLSLLLGLCVAYYFLQWVPAQQRALEARYARVLARIGTNVRARYQAYGQRSELLLCKAADIARAKSPANLEEFKKALTASGQELAAQERSEASLKPLPHLRQISLIAGSQLADPPQFLPDTGRLVFSYRSETLQQYLKLPKMNAKGQLALVKTTTTPNEFMHDLSRPEVFDEFFMVTNPIPQAEKSISPTKEEKSTPLPQADKPPLPQLIYSYNSDATSLNLSNLGGKLPKWLTNDSTGLPTAHQTKITLHGRPYHLFIQPVTLIAPGATKRTMWLLCGAVSDERLYLSSQQLPPALLQIALLLLLLGALALPLLRVLALGARERLNLRDVVGSGIAVVVGVPLLLLLLLSATACYNVAPYTHDSQLDRLADAIDCAVRQETTALYNRLSLATIANTAQLRQSLTTTANTAQFLKNDTTFGFPNSQLSTLASERVPGVANAVADSSDLMQWQSNAGKGLLAFDRTKNEKQYMFSPVPSDYRDWLRKHLASLASLPKPRVTYPGFSPNCCDWFWQQQVVLPTCVVAWPRYGQGGHRSAMLLAAYKLPPLKEPILGLFATPLRSLEAPLLPPGYRFCVVDEQGEVQFHSDPQLTLSENILQDCGADSSRLRAALLSTNAVHLSSFYQGRRCRMRLAPLSALGGPTRQFLLVLADEEADRTEQLQTLLSTTLGVLGLLALLLLPMGLVQLLQTQAVRLPLRESFPRLWPRRQQEPVYQRITVVGGLGIGLFFGLSEGAAWLTQLLLLLALDGWLLGVAVRQLRPSTEARQPMATFWKVAIVAIGNVLTYFLVGFSSDWLRLIVFQLVLWGIASALAALFGPPASLEETGSPGGFSRSLKNSILSFMPVWLSEPGKDSRPAAERATTVRKFTRMLFVWVLILGVLPAVYCYQGIYGLERQRQIRQAHVSLFQQAHHRASPKLLADSATEVQYPWKQRQYLYFFFYSQAITQPEPEMPATSEAEYNSRSLFELLPRLTSAGPAVLPTEAAPPGQRETWQTNKFSLLKRSELRSPELSAANTASVLQSGANDAQLGRHWYWPSDALRYAISSFYYLVKRNDNCSNYEYNKLLGELPRYLLRLAYLLGLLGAVYALVRALVYRAFGFEAVGLYRSLPTSPPVLTPLLDDIQRNREQSYYLICPTADFSNLLPGISNALPDKYELDCRLLATDSSSTDDLAEVKSLAAKLSSDAILTLLLLHFDDAARIPAQTIRKSWWLAKAAKEGWRVVVVARATPDVFADCGDPRTDCKTDGHPAIWEAGDRLLDLLNAYEVRHIAINTQPASTPAQQTNKAAVKPPLERLLLAECAPFPFLTSVKEDLYKDSTFSKQLQDPVADPDAADTLLLRLARRAQLPFRAIWESLTPGQQYLLYDLAQDGLINPLDAPVLSELFHKGLLIVGPQPEDAPDAPDGLRIVSRSFRLFVLNGLAPDQALRLEREAQLAATRPGSWQQRSTSWLVMLVLLAVLLLISQQHALDKTQSILTAVTAALPLLSSVLRGTVLANNK